MSSITLGRYTPRDTFIHRLDPRIKILSLILLMVAIFISYSTWEMTFIIGGILLLFIFLLAAISKTSFKSLFKSLRAMWFLIIFLLLINILVKLYISITKAQPLYKSPFFLYQCLSMFVCGPQSKV